MKAGRELDEKVAREVMGWTKATLHDEVSGPEQYWCSGKVAHVLVESWTPSIFIHYAWQVVEKLRKDGLWFLLEYEEPPKCCYASFYEPIGESGEIRSHGNCYSTTAPLAICLAALKAVGVEVE